MTTRRKVLIGMASAAAATTLPVAIAEPFFKASSVYPGAWHNPVNIVCNHTCRAVDIFINGKQLFAADLEAGKEYIAEYRDGAYHIETGGLLVDSGNS